MEYLHLKARLICLRYKRMKKKSALLHFIANKHQTTATNEHKTNKTNETNETNESPHTMIAKQQITYMSTITL